MISLLARLSTESDGQGIAEYAIMLAVILTLMVTVLRVIGSNAGDVFSRVASALH